MSDFKKFTRIQNRYVLKKQYGFGLIVVLGMAAFTVGGIWYKNTAVIWIFGILTILCAIAIWQENFYIDLDKREFVIKNGLINKPVQIPFSDFINFEVVKVKQNLITTNVCLNLCYNKQHKEKSIGIVQSFWTRSIQNIINEINQILSLDEHSRKI